MKINNLFISLFGLIVLVLTSCEKPFDELEKDPNRPVNAPASLVLKGVLADILGATGSAWDEKQRWNQFYASNYNYYATNEYSWTGAPLRFTTLKNVVKMEQEACRVGLPEVNAYAALGKFFRAYFYEDMTRQVGDLPLTDALKGLDNTAPKYDSQKAVYVQILKWLDEANADMTALIAKGDNAFSGDIYYGNDLRKWQKLVNSYKLRVLVSLSSKETDAELAVKTRFAEVLANPAKFPLLTSEADNWQYLFNSTTNKYNRSPDNFGQNATRENLASTYLSLLTSLKDPRTFVVAEPAPAQLAAGLKPTDFGAFVGASSGEDLADMSDKANKGAYSFQNRKRYYSTYTAEPYVLLGYAEQCFTISEGLNRGWSAATALGTVEELYKKGIQTSWAFYGLKEGKKDVFFSKDGGYKEFNSYSVPVSFATYYAQPGVMYGGNTAAGLKQILTQKYLAFAQGSGMEAWFNQRRTGVPTFLTGVGTGNSQRIPKRWQYPNTERTTNGTNLKQALDSQYSGNDDINAAMWLLN